MTPLPPAAPETVAAALAGAASLDCFFALTVAGPETGRLPSLVPAT